MQFYESHWLNLLWLIPIIIFLFVVSGWLTNKRMRAFLQTSEIQNKLLPHQNKNEWPIRATLLLAAFIFSVFALAQPQWGEEKKKIERKGVDIIFMLDVSTSMLAEDIKPSRIQKARFEIETFVQRLKGDRIGMLAFAGSSFMQTPLTLDYSAFLIFLSGVEVGHVPDPGTSLGPAIEKAIAAFPDEKGKYRALIVFSDGEDHELQIDSAIESAKKRNVRIYTVGTATAEGAPIPLKNEKGVQTAVKKDRVGNIVITKLNKEILKKAASETGGVYLPATPGEKEIELILRHLTSLGVKKLEDRLVTEKEDHYQIFVFLTLICLILEMLVSRNKSSRAMPLSMLIIFFLLHSGFISTPQNKIDEGNEDFSGKRYQSAVQKYREVQVKNPDSPPVEYNLATSLYKVDQYQESAAHLKNAVEKSVKDPELQAKAAYNYGNALYRVGDFEGAIKSYKKALELNPQDNDAKYNLEFLLDKKSKFEKENQDRKKNNPDKKKDDKKQQDKKNQQSQGGGSNQDQKQSSGGKDQQNKSGGGGSNQDQGQGQKNEDKQGSGQQQQNKDQDQSGQGQQKQDSAGQKNDPNQKDQGQGQNQQDQNQSNGSDQNKKPDENSGGTGQPDKKENQSQSDKNDGDQGQSKNQDQKDQGKDQAGPGQNNEPNNQGGGSPKPDQNQSQNPGQEGGQKPGNQPQGAATGTDKKPGQSNQPQTGQDGKGKPLQGQMSKEDAEYLLGSLEDGEKKFHVLRKPAQESPEAPDVEKDW